jgi:hypothetical protein
MLLLFYISYLIGIVSSASLTHLSNDELSQIMSHLDNPSLISLSLLSREMHIRMKYPPLSTLVNQRRKDLKFVNFFLSKMMALTRTIELGDAGLFNRILSGRLARNQHEEIDFFHGGVTSTESWWNNTLSAWQYMTLARKAAFFGNPDMFAVLFNKVSELKPDFEQVFFAECMQMAAIANQTDFLSHYKVIHDANFVPQEMLDYVKSIEAHLRNNDDVGPFLYNDSISHHHIRTLLPSVLALNNW